MSKLCAGSRIAQAVMGGNDAPKYFAAMTTTVMRTASTYKTKPSDIRIVLAPAEWSTRYTFATLELGTSENAVARAFVPQPVVCPAHEQGYPLVVETMPASGPNSFASVTPNMSASFVRARLTLLLMVPTAH
jgi:hypothetical protein